MAIKRLSQKEIKNWEYDPEKDPFKHTNIESLVRSIHKNAGTLTKEEQARANMIFTHPAYCRKTDEEF